MTINRPLIYGAGALFVSGLVSWELSRRRTLSELDRDEGSERDGYVSGRDIWRSVSDDVEPTLLENPEGVIEYHRQLTVTR